MTVPRGVVSPDNHPRMDCDGRWASVRPPSGPATAIAGVRPYLPSEVGDSASIASSAMAMVSLRNCCSLSARLTVA